MVENIKEMKKKITQDWQKAFPELVRYNENKFYKIVGPIIIGLELIKLPRVEEYRPHLVVYPLWNNDLKECLSAPSILVEFKNKKGLQFSIPYNKHSLYFDEAIQAIKKQSQISLEGNIKLKSLISLIDNYSKIPPLSAAPNSYLQAKLKEFKYNIVINSSNDKLIKKTFSEIEKKNWDSEHFKLWGTTVSIWLNDLKSLNKEEIIKNIEVNNRNKKLEKLLVSELK